MSEPRPTPGSYPAHSVTSGHTDGPEGLPTRTEAPTDEVLATMAQRGDFDAFDEIVYRHQASLWRLLFKFCPHESELEDLVQNTFIKAHQKLPLWKATGSFGGWLRKVAVNVGYDHVRKRKNEPITVAQRSTRNEDSDPLSELADRASEDSQHPNAELIEQILAKLSPDDRLLVTLHYYEGYSHPEIAEQLDWGLSKTKVRIHRTRKKLETLLTKHGLEMD